MGDYADFDTAQKDGFAKKIDLQVGTILAEVERLEAFLTSANKLMDIAERVNADAIDRNAEDFNYYKQLLVTERPYDSKMSKRTQDSWKQLSNALFGL